ncbi:transposase [[Clostridium] scindens]|uniref:transposase n=1 Tax=Clostridium scindens (strain JCM 10418 / VPI 12708) TaxID=29347 RepID=UPI002FE5EC1F
MKHLSLHILSEPVSLHPIGHELILSEKTLLTCPSALHPHTMECIITNLNEKDFPMEEIKKLCRLRWGIERSFRELK